VAVTDSIRPSALPFPANDAEALVFAQLYEALVRLDCNGRPRPALADSWRRSAGGRIWDFRLRRHARFWDGSPAEAADVVASWLWAARRAKQEGRCSPYRELEPLAERVRILDERRLRITLTEPRDDLPALLAAPALRVSAERPRLTWRLGTGSFRPESLVLPPGSVLRCIPHESHPAVPSCPLLVFERRAEEEDYLRPEDDAQLFLLRDPGRIAYHRARRSGARLMPLTYDRLYALLLPGAGASDPPGGWLAALQADLRQGDLLPELALPAGAGDLAEFLGGEGCASPSSAPDSGGASTTGGLALGSRIIHYAADDPAARALAHRIAALASPSAGGAAADYPRAAGLDRDALETSLRACLPSSAGTAGAEAPPVYILAIRRGEAPLRLLLGARALPLALTRPFLVTKGSVTGVGLGGDGMPRLDSVGWRKDRRSDLQIGGEGRKREEP